MTIHLQRRGQAPALQVPIRRTSPADCDGRRISAAGDVVVLGHSGHHIVEVTARQNRALASHGVGVDGRAVGRPWRSSAARCGPSAPVPTGTSSARPWSLEVNGTPARSRPVRPMMTTGRSLPCVGSSSYGTHVHTTSPGSGSPSMSGLYSIRTPLGTGRVRVGADEPTGSPGVRRPGSLGSRRDRGDRPAEESSSRCGERGHRTIVRRRRVSRGRWRGGRRTSRGERPSVPGRR